MSEERTNCLDPSGSVDFEALYKTETGCDGYNKVEDWHCPTRYNYIPTSAYVEWLEDRLNKTGSLIEEATRHMESLDDYIDKKELNKINHLIDDIKRGLDSEMALGLILKNKEISQ